MEGIDNNRDIQKAIDAASRTIGIPQGKMDAAAIIEYMNFMLVKLKKRCPVAFRDSKTSAEFQKKVSRRNHINLIGESEESFDNNFIEDIDNFKNTISEYDATKALVDYNSLDTSNEDAYVDSFFIN